MNGFTAIRKKAHEKIITFLTIGKLVSMGTWVISLISLISDIFCFACLI